MKSGSKVANSGKKTAVKKLVKKASPIGTKGKKKSVAPLKAGRKQAGNPAKIVFKRFGM